MNRFLVLAALAGVVGCSSSRMVEVEPRVNLREYGTVGLMEFTSATSAPAAERTSREFLAAVQAAQPGVPVLELEQRDFAGQKPGGTLDPSLIRMLGAKHNVDVILFGVLEAKEVKPKVSVDGGLESLSASAEIEGELHVKLYDTESGATIWTVAARDRQKVAGLSISGGGLTEVGMNDPGESEQRMLHNLVARATNDFRSTWKRVKVEE